MNIPRISLALETDRQRILSTLACGFTADPLARWFYPEAHEYLNCKPFFDAFCGGAIGAGSSYRSENYEGAAMWFPPSSGPDEEKFIEHLETTIRKEILEDCFRLLELMGEHRPTEPCWYLAVIGVDCAYQGAGFGAELMKYALKRIDTARLPSYLEASSPRNMALYKRHGFEEMGVIQFGSSPPIVPMFRFPKT